MANDWRNFEANWSFEGSRFQHLVKIQPNTDTPFGNTLDFWLSPCWLDRKSRGLSRRTRVRHAAAAKAVGTGSNLLLELAREKAPVRVAEQIGHRHGK